MLLCYSKGMLKKMKLEIDRGLDELLRETKPAVDKGGRSSTLFRGISDFVKRDGKRIRPILFMLGYLGYTKKRKIDRKRLVKAALSLELLHDFLLIHDDIIDRSALRRGKPALHILYNRMLGRKPADKLGSDLAIVAGDIIFAHAVKCFMAVDENASRKEKSLELFTVTASNTGLGEYVDVVNNIAPVSDISEKEIMFTYLYKTAKYTFASPLLMGAMLAGTGKRELSIISELGTALGQAFQIQDDMLDIFSSMRKTGKPVLSDLIEGKKTLLAWKAFRSLKGKDKKALASFLASPRKTLSGARHARSLIKRSGAPEYCFSRMNAGFEQAVSLCTQLSMGRKELSVLGDFIQSLVGRNNLICP